jgi:molybdopterin/thiamine biosynthesis adenylyltransferase
MIDRQEMKDYLALYAGQLPAIGSEGQLKLAETAVHVSGVGHIGSMLLFNAVNAGVLRLSANDPQVVEQENVGHLIYARKCDIGKPKVYAMEEFLHGRPLLQFGGIYAPNEAEEVDRQYRETDWIFSAANSVEARLRAERAGVVYGIPVMQVAVFDAREAWGGLITHRLPENAEWAGCFADLLQPGMQFPRGEGLIATVTTALAALASNMFIQIITGVADQWVRRNNVFVVDLTSYYIKAYAVRKRSGERCRICGQS